MKLLILLCVLLPSLIRAQIPVDSIKETEVKRIIEFLASDELKGRGNYTTELHLAAGFIADEFDKAGLKAIPGSKNFFYPFAIKDGTRPWKDSAGLLNPSNILVNVIGILPGKSLPHEIIVFSAHFDHVGLHDPFHGYDGRVYNGANDNASGTTALILLAKYFAQRGDNERSIMFCAFSGEELGLLGSEHFSTKVDASAIKAMINIEMIGIPGVGTGSFFITGSTYSNLPGILKANLKDSPVRIKKESGSTDLFPRSDNFPFAKKTIPAHTIMASNDYDPCYHRICDESDRISVSNMTTIIRAIATAAKTLISGKDTPSRINPRKLRM